MSMARCNRCEEIIDTDDDPEACIADDTDGLEKWEGKILCEQCREHETEECTCTTPIASVVDIEPPERRRNPYCPTHGNRRDPDDERDRRRDDEMWQREQERYETGGDE